MAALVMYPAGGGISPPLPLALKFAAGVSHPFVGPDEPVAAAKIGGFRYLHAISGFDQLFHILEGDETVDPMALIVRARREKIEVASEHVPQTLAVRRHDGDEKSLRTLGHPVFALTS